MPDNGICERFHRTVLDEFYRVAFRKRIYRTIDELQADLDAWLLEYNEHRPHHGVITITGIGDHLRPEWPITITGTRTKRSQMPLSGMMISAP